MEYNTDELHAPEWLNAEFIKEVIESSQQRSDVKVQDYKITPGTAVGDHFASIMFRTNVDYTTDDGPNQKISLIIKTFPVVEGFKKDVLGTMDIFEAEIAIYTQVLNGCQEILKKCGYNELLVAKLLYSSLKPHKILVFEDLKELGYYMLPSTQPNEHETRLIYSKLAQYHAVTYKMLADGRNDLNFKGTIFTIPMIKELDFYRTAHISLANMLTKIPNFEEYIQQIRAIDYDSFLQKCIDSAVNHFTAFNVLNHGDYHIRNMMFKSNENGAVAEIVLVDFQLPHLGSPAYDLVYMATAIPCKYRKMAFQHYYNVFSDVLVKTGYSGEIPTYEQLLEEIKRFAHIDLFIQMTLGGFVHLDKRELGDGDFNKLLTDPELRQKFYSSPSYVAQMKELIPELLAIINEKNE